jgi:serine/threonine protein kinase
MLTGVPPYRKPTRRDRCYKYIMDGKMKKMLSAWVRTMSDTALDLVSSLMHRDPRRRPSLEEVMVHPFVQGGQRLVELERARECVEAGVVAEEDEGSSVIKHDRADKKLRVKTDSLHVWAPSPESVRDVAVLDASGDCEPSAMAFDTDIADTNIVAAEHLAMGPTALRLSLDLEDSGDVGPDSPGHPLLTPRRSPSNGGG